MLETDAAAPSGLRHDRFVAEPLTADVADLDHAAYVASPEVMRVHSDGRWPVVGFTRADNLVLVARHRADHESGRAFTFTLLTPDRTASLGCLYLNPLRDYLARVAAGPQVLERIPAASAMVTFWLRQDQQDTGLAESVVAAVDTWLREEWPLTTYLFRVLPNERSSRRALEGHGLRRTDLANPPGTPPYLWYAPA